MINDYNKKYRYVHSCDKEDRLETSDGTLIISSVQSSGSSSPASTSGCTSSSSDAEMIDLTSGCESPNSSAAATDVDSESESCNNSVFQEIDNSLINQGSSLGNLPKDSDQNAVRRFRFIIENPFSQESHSLKKSRSWKEPYNEQEREARCKVIDFALQFLLRVFEIQLPSEEVTKAENVKALVRYICWTKQPSHRAGLILNRISKSMKYIKPFLLQGLFPWLRLEVGERLYGAKELTCPTCQSIKSTFTSIYQEFVFAAETGYIEGTVCHALVTGPDKTRTVMTIGIVAIIMCKTLLYNILITHGGFDVFVDALEKESGEMFSHAVLSLRLLAERLNLESAIDLADEQKSIVEPYVNVVDDEEIQQPNAPAAGHCYYDLTEFNYDFELVMDDGIGVEANRRVLSKANSVFEAMLEGRFIESSDREVHLPGANSTSVRILVHYLYGCQNCRVVSDNSDIDAWLDLLPLTDRYLLLDLNRELCRKVMRLCTRDVSKVIHAYRKSLDIICPTRGQEEALNTSIVTFLLVGNLHHPVRVKLFDELAKDPTLNATFLDDIANLILDKLKAELRKPRRHIFKSH